MKKAFTGIREQIISLNLFKQHYNDVTGRRNEIITTRCYVLLMMVGMTVIVFYASLVEHTLTYHVRRYFL